MYLYSRHPVNEVQEVINFYIQKGYNYEMIQQLDYRTLYDEYKKYKEEKKMNITLEFCEKCAKSMELRYEVAEYSKLSVKLCKNCEIKLLKAFDEFREKLIKKEEEKNESENDN